MSQYKMVLTETDLGRNDHGKHLGRRKKAKKRADDLNIKVISITETPGYCYIYEWIVDDPSDSNVYVLCWYFNTQGYVTSPGPVRQFTEEEASKMIDLFNKFSENARASGDF